MKAVFEFPNGDWTEIDKDGVVGELRVYTTNEEMIEGHPEDDDGNRILPAHTFHISIDGGGVPVFKRVSVMKGFYDGGKWFGSASPAESIREGLLAAQKEIADNTAGAKAKGEDTVPITKDLLDTVHTFDCFFLGSLYLSDSPAEGGTAIYEHEQHPDEDGSYYVVGFSTAEEYLAYIATLLNRL